MLSPSSYLFKKWRDLTWLHIVPKFNLQRQRKISTGFKMAMLTPELGIENLYA